MKFYSKEEVKTITEELKAGVKVTEIARKYSKQWDRTLASLIVKVSGINKELGRCGKRGRPAGSKNANVTKITTNNNGGVVLTSGFVFDFKPQRAEMHQDHVRLYF